MYISEEMDEEVRKDIKQIYIKFSDAVRKRDAAALTTLYTEDARLLPPNSEIIQGKQAIQNYWGVAFGFGPQEVTLTTVELAGIGDEVNEIGNFEYKIYPEGQEPIVDKGKFVVYWKRTADGWKMHWDIWNSSLPLPE